MLTGAPSHHLLASAPSASTAVVLESYGIRSSLSRSGNCWDNAVAESFFSTLKLDLLYPHSWPSRAAARSAIFRVHRGLLQPRAPPLDARCRQPQSGRLRIRPRRCVFRLAIVSVEPGQAQGSLTPIGLDFGSRNKVTRWGGRRCYCRIGPGLSGPCVLKLGTPGFLVGLPARHVWRRGVRTLADTGMGWRNC